MHVARSHNHKALPGEIGSLHLAGVPDIEEAQNLLKFAKTYELIKKDNQSKLRLVEVDASTLASKIPS